MSGFWLQQQASLLAFLAVLLAVAASNWRAWRRMERYPRPERWPSVSVLIPARNERENIGPCVESLLAQRYPDFQVLVLDDESTDGTGQIVAGLAAGDRRLRLLPGQPLPPGWLGKHWACQQLAEAAGGELLLFVDADTRHHPDALADAVSALEAERAAMLSAMPRQQVGSWAERLLIPIIPWALFSFLPLGPAYALNWRALAAGIGQFMLFRRAAYHRLGGHAAVRGHAADDLALARRAAGHGLRWRLLDGGARVQCRMYRNAGQVMNGLSKNLFAAFDYRLLPFAFVWLWLLLVFWGPLVALAVKLAWPGAPLSAGLALAAVAASLVLWGLACLRFRFPLYLVPLYPASVLLAVLISARSLVLSLAGRATWKERTLVREKAG